ncbi:GNAT family N-acetyltransferase [Bacillus sp. KH172YL63]|uniref:GNAT family N-acetyltransferase n=1 Tax=Bacillus sp. KH172YL63 TaxID=2709784 RepID=UPI0013E457FC|nr:GNAT family N-acetyltransferase [Bacillus sp. KH172YL63]BCB05353.1 N-acetyltransferase [Bacillus sp. KH172YL63]
MIRQLTEKDHELCQRLIHQQPAENLFIIGDIEAFGYEQDFQKIWGDFDDEENLRGVLLKYRENFIPFAVGEFDAEGFASIINGTEDYGIMSGLKRVVSEVEPFLTRSIKSKRHMHYAKCDSTSMMSHSPLPHVKEADLTDIPRLVALLNSIPEFSGGDFTVEKRKHSMEAGVSRSYYVEKDGMFVSSASTTAENSLSAMIVAVCTHPEYKKQGYATDCMTKLCRDVLEEGKELCLFYDNPEAGKIYKRIGFKDIGYWSLYKFHQ